MKMINHLLTGIDGKTYDPARVLWVAGIVAYLVYAGYSVFVTNQFDMSEFAIGYSALLAAGAAGVKIKETTEPPAEQ